MGDEANVKKLALALLKMCKASATVIKVHRKNGNLDEAISLLRESNGETVSVLRGMKSELRKLDIDLDE